ncbi:MAG TPA: HRDC domain-containing protein [Gemmatimonadales bacterium]|nr:HRDC domain-containing protein [Gemmatimonadales bacterium]
MTLTAKEIQFVDTPAGFDDLLARLGHPTRIAVDTEAASYHRYSDGVCLVQLSTPEITAVVDVPRLPSLAGLGALLRRPEVESVFHDADYDLRLLDRDHRIGVARLFDTRIAAQLLGEPGIGLAALLEKYQGVTLDKKFQRADWSVRPMAPGMLEYAAADTHYLLALRDLMEHRLRDAGRMTWAEEEFAIAAQVRWEEKPADEAYLKVKGARLLKPRQLAVLRELYAWRDATAKRMDRATFRVMNPDVLLALAELQPREVATLKGIRGISPDQVERRGRELVEAVARGLAVPESELPRFERTRRPPPDPAFDARLERLKQARNAAAERLDLQPGVLCPNGILEGIARVEPRSVDEMTKVEEMRRWQREVLGAELLAALHTPA